MNIKLLTEQHLEVLSLTGGCTGSPETTFVKMPHCWKSHVAAQLYDKYQYLIGELIFKALNFNPFILDRIFHLYIGIHYTRG